MKHQDRCPNRSRGSSIKRKPMPELRFCWQFLFVDQIYEVVSSACKSNERNPVEARHARTFFPRVERVVEKCSAPNRHSHACEGLRFNLFPRVENNLFFEFPYFALRFAFFKVLAFVLFFPYLTDAQLNLYPRAGSICLEWDDRQPTLRFSDEVIYFTLF